MQHCNVFYDDSSRIIYLSCSSNLWYLFPTRCWFSSVKFKAHIYHIIWYLEYFYVEERREHFWKNKWWDTQRVFCIKYLSCAHFIGLSCRKKGLIVPREKKKKRKNYHSFCKKLTQYFFTFLFFIDFYSDYKKYLNFCYRALSCLSLFFSGVKICKKSEKIRKNVQLVEVK